jgi:peptide-methionine (R)-S-oxide reductase
MQINPHLTPEQKKVLFDKATEAPFTGALLHNEKTGMYTCANCGSDLFMSGTKFESGSGWPSFYEPAKEGAVVEVTDESHGMVRIEATCGTCGAHLGHIFNDATNQPTGMRYCINSASLSFNDKNQ